MEKAQVRAAISAAKVAPFVPARASGCGRAYVCLSGTDKATLRHVAQVCADLGLIFQRKGYGVSNAIYIGYDNADGHALGRAEAFAQVLCDQGISAYMDAVAD